MHLLEQRNDELEQEIHHLKQRDLFSPMLPAGPSKVAPGNDNKAIFSAPPPPLVDVHPAGSEYKLTLGGYIQANLEDGDVSAFEGRFGATALEDRFRLRRARLTLAGDFKEDFDFKIQGDFELSDSAITALKTVNTTAGATTTVSNSNRWSLPRPMFTSTGIISRKRTSRSVNIRRPLGWNISRRVRSFSRSSAVCQRARWWQTGRPADRSHDLG